MKEITGRIDLEFRDERGRTVVERQQFSGLLRASRPVYRGAGNCPEIQLVHLGPGCMDRDSYEQRLVLGKGTSAVVGFQSYAKLLPGAVGATQRTTVMLEPGSRLTMKPNVVIPYPNCTYASTTSVHVSEGAQVTMSDILVHGQDTPPDALACNQVSLTTLAFRDAQLVLRDCLQVGLQSLGRGRVWAKGWPVLGSVYILGDVSRPLEQGLRQVIESFVEMDIQVGLSQIEHAGFVMRILGGRVQLVEHVIERISAAVHSYHAGGDGQGRRMFDDSSATK
ncbi:urease accessory protein UreD [Alicyclobacillus fastidiosus]|uniref:Urease accessory protein UreD n=1 Tax=Alicyclobacillus fastidiosus TaxID=392011 RepID=A0ABY6ZE56_9BACL|nr:urease accessory protein UreD [Alicyclobacillus fastidiosus]WAH41179.1 urease accessory protein UreD [Alicyclobacillus fastidiosus]GMA62755.1 hypothetical protein GCM10025859_31950 [Alicyclobacillus fastidiosus]